MRHGSCLEHGHAHEREHAAWSRRDFLVRTGLAAGGVSFMLGARPMTAFAQAPLLVRLAGESTDRILVLVQLSGGNDGLNTVVPIENEVYYNHRPTIAVPKAEALRLSDTVGLHPAFASLMPMWADGHMGVVHTVGYPDQSRSHFRGTDIWATASDAEAFESTGWTGRYLAGDNPDWLLNPPAYPLAVRVGGATATLFQSRYGNLSMTFSDAGQFSRFVQQGGFYDEAAVPQTSYGEAMRFARGVANASYRYVGAVQSAATRAVNRAEYPNGGFADSLAVVARLIRGNLGSRVYTVAKGGFDTHAMQGASAGGHADLLRDLSNSLAAFFADLKQDGLDERVLVATFSEFGRTLGENGSRGTDHGAAAPMILLGSGLNGGLYGTQSPLTPAALTGGDPRFTTDFRSVYATVLDGWFGLPAGEVDTLLGRRFERLGFARPAATAADVPDAPAGFTLGAPFPNPSAGAATIPFALDRAGHARLSVYDALGREVAVLADGALGAGVHRVRFDPPGAWAAGTYFVRLETASGSRTQPVVRVR